VNLFPTRATFHVAMAGTAMIVAGVAMHRASPVAFGGALLLTLVLGRGLSLLAANRIRRSGFEMGWVRDARVLTVARGEEAVLEFVLKNRGKDPAQAMGLRAVASSLLTVDITPCEIYLPPGSVATLAMRIVGKRVGRWGIHGLALELRGMPLGGDGPFDAPLVFSCPHGVEVGSRPLVAMLRSPRGGRSGRITELGRSARTRGEGDDLRELRDHVVGDPFKKIAWRASARRGRLVVREMERQERDTVWLVVDASVDGWAGTPGTAPLDRTVDEAAAVAVRHLARGDHVGLVVVASRPRSWIGLGQGPAQAALIAHALASCSGMIDVDRSELDEHGVAHRVAEHLRPLTRGEPWTGRTADMDRLAGLAESMRNRAPFAARVPYAPSPRERSLRHYMACFGMEGPPRTEGERAYSESELGRTLMKLSLEKPRPSIVVVWAPPPSPEGLVARSIRRLRARRAVIRWAIPDVLPSVDVGKDGHDLVARETDGVASSVARAVRVRAEADRDRGAFTLRALGVEVETRVARMADVLAANGRDEDARREGRT
jgi:uncharacterized protein (DUF58 family)